MSAKDPDKGNTIKAVLPKWLRYTVLDYSHLLEIPEDQLVSEALRRYLPALEELRTLKESRAWPRQPGKQ